MALAVNTGGANESIASGVAWSAILAGTAGGPDLKRDGPSTARLGLSRNKTTPGLLRYARIDERAWGVGYLSAAQARVMRVQASCSDFIEVA